MYKLDKRSLLKYHKSYIFLIQERLRNKKNPTKSGCHSVNVLLSITDRAVNLVTRRNFSKIKIRKYNKELSRALFFQL